MTTTYYTATTLDGFIATTDHSLDWLLSRQQDPMGPLGWSTFQPRIGSAAMGASTWQWLLDHDPAGWDKSLRCWVFTHRDFAPSEGVTFTSAPIEEVHAQLVEAAAGKDVWIIGGGDLAGQFADAGLLDEVIVSIAPVTLGAGAPLLPRHVELRLEETGQNGELLGARYTVVR